MSSGTANTPLDNAIIKGLEGTQKWDSTSLTFWFAASGDAAAVNPIIAGEGIAGASFNPITSGENHHRAVNDAFWAYSYATALTFTAAADFASADIRIIGVDNYTGLNGSMEFPSATGTSNFLFNTNTGNLLLAPALGAMAAVDRVAKHELGHGLGLGHPHDTGNGTTSWTLSDATGGGDDEIDNERYTVMSYERGGLDVKFERAFGHSITLSALDIAALQHMYGANTTAHSGDTSYALTDRETAALDKDGSDGTVSIGRGFYTIWDTGGTDEIRYDGSKSVYINLNAASLSKTDTADIGAMIRQVKKASTYDELPNELKQDIENPEYHSGGFISRIFQGTDVTKLDLGGYSIANGVVIEDAIGDGGNDFLIGNASSNLLMGFGGKDYIHSGAGDDTIDGGADDDEMFGGGGNDDIDGGAGTDTAVYSGNCSEYELTKDDATGVVTITHTSGIDGTDTLTNVEKVRFLDGEKDITGDVEDLDCPPTDFIFLVDLSGSFGDDLPNFVASARDIAQTMLERDPNTRFALASFVDHPFSPFGSTGDYLYKAELPLTDSIDAFEAALAGLTIFNGGDFPESQWVGLWRAANGVGLSLREDSSKVILLATDAPAHDAGDYGLDETTILDFLNTEGISVGAPPDETGETPGGDGTGDSGDGEGDDIGETPGPDDTGNGANPGLPTGEIELMQSLLIDQLRALGALPIFALTPGGSGYETVTSEAGGAIADLTSSGDNISDALREALAKLDGADFGEATTGDDTIVGTPDPDTLFGLRGNDRIEGREQDDVIDAGADNDTVLGEAGNDTLFGGSGQDTLVGGEGNDTLNGGIGIDDPFDPDAPGQHDFMLGGVGNDTYHVDDTFDLVDEGAAFPDFRGDGTDVDTIVSTADWFWDVYSVGERIEIAEGAAGGELGITIVGSVFNNELVGNSGINIMFGRGGSDIYRGGDGIDWMSMNLLGVNEENAYPNVDGPNTVIVEARETGPFSYDIVFDFESGKDKLDVSDYNYTTTAEVMARGVNDGFGNSYFILGDGLDYLYMVGNTLEELAASDFIV